MPGVEIPFYLFTHQQLVKQLYKKWLMNVKANSKGDCCIWRYYAVLARPDFELILNEKDIAKSRRMYEFKLAQLESEIHHTQLHYATSENGAAVDRLHPRPDFLLDHWHPLEKAQYPEYFAKREARKLQYIQMWDAMYGAPSEAEKGGHH